MTLPQKKKGAFPSPALFFAMIKRLALIYSCIRFLGFVLGLSCLFFSKFMSLSGEPDDMMFGFGIIFLIATEIGTTFLWKDIVRRCIAQECHFLLETP